MKKLVLLLMLSLSFAGSSILNAIVPIPQCFPCPPPPDDPPPAVSEILLPSAQ
jgi:hypothetical protein